MRKYCDYDQLFVSRGVMKRIAVVMLVLLSLTWAVPAPAQIYRGPNSAKEAQKAARRDQKRAAKQQRKAYKRAIKAERRAAKSARRGI
jgi:hypothetical protein